MIFEEIKQRWAESDRSTSQPLIQFQGKSLSLEDVHAAIERNPVTIPEGSIVAHIGDFTHTDIGLLLQLIDRRCIIAPLTESSAHQHETFFETIGVGWVIRNGTPEQRVARPFEHPLIREIRNRQSPGLILFSSGTTGESKAALHDFDNLLNKFRAYKRPGLRTLAFLLFDHIGGLNTLLHTLFNGGTVHIPTSRRPVGALKQIAAEGINLLPTTPSFLRLALMERAFDGLDLSQLRLITYGTERMDQPTLDLLNEVLPEHVDIRQTYGMSELGIFPIKNRSKRELWIKMADPAIELNVRDGVLWVRSPHRMLGYLNAESPFDEDGWYNSRDLVELDDGFFRILGRIDETINVGGIKVQPREVEDAAYTLTEVCFAKAHAEPNPFLGQHIRLDIQLVEACSIDKREFRRKLSEQLDREKMPHKVVFQDVAISPRFKKL